MIKKLLYILFLLPFICNAQVVIDATGKVVLTEDGILISATFSPDDISGLTCWIDPDYGVDTSTVGAQHFVNAIIDRAHVDSAVQTTGAARPEYFVDTINAHNAMYFDGSDDWLKHDSCASDFTGADVPLTIFMVVGLPATPVNGSIISWGNSATNTQFVRYETAATPEYLERHKDDAGVTKDVTAVGNLTGSTDYIITVVSTGTTEDIYYNDTLKKNDADIDIGQQTFDQFAIGVLNRASLGRFYQGFIYYLLIYDSELNATQIGQVHTFINARFNIY